MKFRCTYENDRKITSLDVLMLLIDLIPPIDVIEPIDLLIAKGNFLSI